MPRDMQKCEVCEKSYAVPYIYQHMRKEHGIYGGATGTLRRDKRTSPTTIGKRAAKARRARTEVAVPDNGTVALAVPAQDYLAQQSPALPVDRAEIALSVLIDRFDTIAMHLANVATIDDLPVEYRAGLAKLIAEVLGMSMHAKEEIRAHH